MPPPYPAATQPLPKSPLVIVAIPGSDPNWPIMKEAMDTQPDINVNLAIEATNTSLKMQAGNFPTSVVEMLLLSVSPTDQEIVNINIQQISTGNVLPTSPISLLQFTMDVPEAAVHVVVGSIKTDDTGTTNQFISENFSSNISSDGVTTKRESNVMPTSSSSASAPVPHMQIGCQQLIGTTLKDSMVRLRRLSDIDIDLWTVPKPISVSKPKPTLKHTGIQLEKEHSSTNNDIPQVGHKSRWRPKPKT